MVRSAVKAKELRELGDRELRARLEELKAEQFNLRFQRAVGQLGNPMRIRQVRKDVARILTILRERELQRQREAGRNSPSERKAAEGA